MNQSHHTALNSKFFRKLLNLGIFVVQIPLLMMVAKSSMAQVSISGTVFEDMNYGGGAGRSLAEAEASARASGFPADFSAYATGVRNVLVELYRYDGVDPDNSEWIQDTFTDDDGYYVFEDDIDGDLLNSGHYLIRVVNDSVFSTRDADDAIAFGVQTFRNDPDEVVTEIRNEVGGAHPASEDAFDGFFGERIPEDAQSVTAINATADVENVDFGFNFYTIVNTNDSGQGSLRQFVRNSNDLENDNLAQDLPAGFDAPRDRNGNAVNLQDYETSIFMIPDPTLDSRVTAGTATGQINLSNSPPDGGSGSAFVINIGDNSDELRVGNEYTSIDGRTQTVNVPSVSNSANKTVGSNETTGAEIILNRNSAIDMIYAQASNLIFRSLGLISRRGSESFGLRISENGLIDEQALDTDNVIMEDLTVRTGSCGIQGVQMTNSVIRGSVIRDTAARRIICDNIQLRFNSNDNLIEDNLILRSAYFGIQLLGRRNRNNQILNNQIVGNGTARAQGKTAGIGLVFSTNTQIAENTIRNNFGDGITVTNHSIFNYSNQIRANSIYNNGNLGIDLALIPSIRRHSGDVVSLNDAGDEDDGSNRLQNFPEITITDIDKTTNTYNINVSLNSTPNENFEIELFSNAVCNPSNTGRAQTERYGEGQKYHKTISVTTDGQGNARDSTVLNNVAGHFITATATNITNTTNINTNNTSEFSQCNSPDLRLVKRITAINPGQSDQRLFSNFVDDPSDDNDTNNKWLGANNISDSNDYTLGEINGGLVKPGAEVEYTIYFLSNGTEVIQNVLVCDLIPEHMEFVTNSFNSEPPAENGLPGAARGIVLQFIPTITADSLPVNVEALPIESLTNGNDGDVGYYFPPGVEPSSVFSNIQCSENSSTPNTNGAVVVDLGALPPAEVPEPLAKSSGFIRFRAKVK